MNTLSITSTKTLSYDADAFQAFAIVEKLISFTGTVVVAARTALADAVRSL